MTPQETIARYLAQGGTRHRLQLASGYAQDTVKRVAEGRRVRAQAELDIVEAACRIKPSIRHQWSAELPDDDDSADFFAFCNFPILNTGVNCG